MHRQLRFNNLDHYVISERACLNVKMRARSSGMYVDGRVTHIKVLRALKKQFC